MVGGIAKSSDTNPSAGDGYSFMEVVNVCPAPLLKSRRLWE